MALQSPAYYKELLLERVTRAAITLQPKASKGIEYHTWALLDDADAELVASRRTLEPMRDIDLSEILHPILFGDDDVILTEIERLTNEHMDLLAWKPHGHCDTRVEPVEPVKLQRLKKLQMKLHKIALKNLENLYHKGPVEMKLDDFFICYVENFANGWVEIQERTKLFFEYKRSFWFFLEQLQDASRQSVKYPKILQSLAEEKIAEASQRRKSGKEARKPEQSNADAPIFREHCTNETGYTLLDGCWFYRTVQPYLQDDANSPGYEPSTPLQCNDDYEMMKDKLQQCALEIKKNRAIEKLERDEMIKEAKNHPKRNDNQKKRDVRTIMEAVKWQPRFADVILTHSIDKLATKMHKEQQELDREEEERFQLRFKESLTDNANSSFVIEHGFTGPGERYTDMMARVCRTQKNAWGTGGLEGALKADLLVREEEIPDIPLQDIPLQPWVVISPSIREKVGLQRVDSGFRGSSASIQGEPRSDATS